MAQDVGMDRATAADTVTGAFIDTDNPADGAQSGPTSAIDFGAVQPLTAAFELKLDCQASCTDYAMLIAVWSHDNTDYPTYDHDNEMNGDIVAIVHCKASTVVIFNGEFDVKARYCKFYLHNESGGTINNSSSALLVWDGFADIA